MKDHIGKIFAVLAVVAIAGSVAYSNHVANEANEGVELVEHVKGNPDGAVTLVEYSDFQCPACGQFAPYVADVMDDYGEDIRFEYRHFPLVSIHPYAIPAARAAEAASQQGQFWEMHDKLFANQQMWANSGNPVTHFNTYAEEIGLDVALFKRHYKASLIEDAVTEDFRDAQNRGLRSTPTFFLNGQQMQIESFADFRSQIEAALGVAETDQTSTTTAADTATSAAEADIQFGI